MSTLNFVLIVEDDQQQAEILGRFLAERGYRVHTAATGAAVAELMEEPEFILLDLNLPDTDGVALCPQLKHRFPQAFVLMLTARKEEIDRVVGLEVGADDYLVKPYSLRELEARMRAIRRRHRRTEQNAKATANPPAERVFHMDEGTCSVRHADKTVVLTVREFRVLDWLVRHPGRIFSRNRIIEACWAEDLHITDRVVDAMVARIRKKLKNNFGKPFIFTKHGMGYGWRNEP